MTDDIFETPSATPNFKTELAAQLAELVPEAFADGKVDFEKLKELLAPDVAEGNERFGLFWPGKRQALRAAQEPTTATLRPDRENSKDWDTTQNVFIEGDNLEVLKTLQRHYHNKIQMIYIDPPYNTGNDFVYPDNYKEGLTTYLEWTKQVNEEGKKISTNPETEGRYHSNWLNMMYPRLKLARNLLTDDGLIFISIDDHEQENLLRICAEIFGESNVLASLTVVNNLKGRSDDEYFATANEFMIVCARNAENATIYGFPPDEKYQAEFKLNDGISNYKEVTLQKTGKNSRRTDRPNLHYPIYYSKKTKIFSLEKTAESVEIFPSTINGVDGIWRWGRETFLRNKDTELTAREVKGTWRISVKMRDVVDGDTRSVRPKSVWIDPKYDTASGSRSVKELFDGVNHFDNPKPVAFINDILTIGSRKDSVVLDFFAGSGTTAHAVMQQNAVDGGRRKFILVQLPHPIDEKSDAYLDGYRTISELARKRIDLSGEKIIGMIDTELDFPRPAPDIGFRAFKLADTNFSKWQVSSAVEVEELQQSLKSAAASSADEASQEDLLTEILLKQGYSLTETIKSVEIGGLEVHSVGDGLVLAYLSERTKPTLSQLRVIVNEIPERLIILEDTFQGDDELKTNLVQLAKSKNIELWTA